MNSSIIERLTLEGRLDRIFIGGEWVLPAGRARTAVIDPSTEQAVADIALGSAQDVDAAAALWERLTPAERAEVAERVSELQAGGDPVAAGVAIAIIVAMFVILALELIGRRVISRPATGAEP